MPMKLLTCKVGPSPDFVKDALNSQKQQSNEIIGTVDAWNDSLNSQSPGLLNQMDMNGNGQMQGHFNTRVSLGSKSGRVDLHDIRFDTFAANGQNMLCVSQPSSQANLF